MEVPDTMKDFRPISCCNVLYKCITKIIVNRIKPLLSGLIGCQQSVFVPGHQSGDNILMMQELMQGYHKDGGVGWCDL